MMVNPWYQRINSQPSNTMQTQFSQSGNMMNPFQQMNMIRQAMTNPAGFLKQRFPDIPDEIMQNPNQIFNYLQQTRGQISNEEIQRIQSFQKMIPGF